MIGIEHFKVVSRKMKFWVPIKHKDEDSGNVGFSWEGKKNKKLSWPSLCPEGHSFGIAVVEQNNLQISFFHATYVPTTIFKKIMKYISIRDPLSKYFDLGSIKTEKHWIQERIYAPPCNGACLAMTKIIFCRDLHQKYNIPFSCNAGFHLLLYAFSE